MTGLFGSPETAVLPGGRPSTKDRTRTLVYYNIKAFGDRFWFWYCGASALAEWTVERV